MRFDLPTPDLETQPFWDGCKEGRFLIRHCNACGDDHFYPRPFCPKCWSDDVAWKEACGRATLYTYSVVHLNDLPPFNERVPYVAAVVELDEGPRVMTNIEGVRVRRAARSACRVVVDFKPISDDITIAIFRPAAEPVASSAVNDDEQDWNFPFEEPLHEVFPQLHAAQNAWMAQIDSLDGARPQDARAHPHGRDRRACAIPTGVQRHAQLAREVGATWEEILGSIMLTVPGLRVAARGRGDPARARAATKRRARPKHE